MVRSAHVAHLTAPAGRFEAGMVFGRCVDGWVILRFQFLDVFAAVEHAAEMFFVLELSEVIGACHLFTFIEQLFFHVFLMFVPKLFVW